MTDETELTEADYDRMNEAGNAMVAELLATLKPLGDPYACLTVWQMAFRQTDLSPQVFLDLVGALVSKNLFNGEPVTLHVAPVETQDDLPGTVH